MENENKKRKRIQQALDLDASIYTYSGTDRGLALQAASLGAAIYHGHGIIGLAGE
jgi:hypothetical protein